MGGQPDLGKVSFADAPVNGIETDGVRFAVHVDVGRPCLCGYATLVRRTATEPAVVTVPVVVAAARTAGDALPP